MRNVKFWEEHGLGFGDAEFKSSSAMCEMSTLRHMI